MIFKEKKIIHRTWIQLWIALNKWKNIQPYSTQHADHRMRLQFANLLRPKWKCHDFCYRILITSFKSFNAHELLKTTKQFKPQWTAESMNKPNQSHNNTRMNVSIDYELWIMWHSRMPTMERLENRMTNKYNKNYIIIKRFVQSIFSIYSCRMTHIFPSHVAVLAWRIQYSGILSTNSYLN